MDTLGLSPATSACGKGKIDLATDRHFLSERLQRWSSSRFAVISFGHHKAGRDAHSFVAKADQGRPVRAWPFLGRAWAHACHAPGRCRLGRFVCYRYTRSPSHMKTSQSQRAQQTGLAVQNSALATKVAHGWPLSRHVHCNVRTSGMRKLQGHMV